MAKCQNRVALLLMRAPLLNILTLSYCAITLLLKLSNTIEDIDFSPNDFVLRVNADLVGKLVNIASRCAGFIHKYFESTLNPGHSLILYGYLFFDTLLKRSLPCMNSVNSVMLYEKSCNWLTRLINILMNINLGNWSKS